MKNKALKFFYYENATIYTSDNLYHVGLPDRAKFNFPTLIQAKLYVDNLLQSEDQK